MDIKEIKKSVLKKYPGAYADIDLEGDEKLGMRGILSEINGMEINLRKQLEDFLQKGIKPKGQVGEWSVEKLMSERGMNEIAALLTLDWLIKEPQKAADSLAKGRELVS
jgi:hypothetical protein